jgi:large conductance mechanosensitive channel
MKGNTMWKEFKEFALHGNMLDLAVGLILGIAFGAVVASLVKDLLMPPIGLLLGKVDFSNLYATIAPGQPAGPYPTLAAAQQAGAVTLNYGLFLMTLINFFFVALAVFMLVKAMNRLRPPTATQKPCPYCLSKIPSQASRCAFCTAEQPKA